MRKVSHTIATAVLATATAHTAIAAAPATKASSPWSVGLRAGTLGFGGEVQYNFNDTFALSAYGSSFLHERETLEIAKVKYKHTTIKLLSGGVLAHWYFLKNGFRVTGGVVLNGNKIRLHRDLTTEPAVTIEGVTLPGFAIGTVRSTYRYQRIAPYAGLGYDSPQLWGTPLSLTVDLGVLCQGEAKAHASATGPASASPVFRDKLKKYAEKLVNDYQALKTYPVINIGLRYRF